MQATVQLLRSHSHSLARSPPSFLERMGSSLPKPRGIDSDSSEPKMIATPRYLLARLCTFWGMWECARTCVCVCL